jgi:hypothetical protein
MPEPLHITHHAVERYQERVANLPDAAVRAALASPAVHTAAAIGAPFVKLATGQRIVLRGSRVITVLPEYCDLRLLSTHHTAAHRAAHQQEAQ